MQVRTSARCAVGGRPGGVAHDESQAGPGPSGAAAPASAARTRPPTAPVEPVRASRVMSGPLWRRWAGVGVKRSGKRSAPVLPETGSHSPGPAATASGIRAARSGSATAMSVRATKWPRQWCTPAPKPWWGGRCAVMSKAGSAMADGSVPAAWESIWTIPPRGMRRPWKSTSSSASRVTQVTVGFTRITSSTAWAPSSGRSASSRHWSGWRVKVWTARPSWLRVVSMPAKARKTRATPSSCRESRPPPGVAGSLAWTRVVTRSSRGWAIRAATTSSR